MLFPASMVTGWAVMTSTTTYATISSFSVARALGGVVGLVAAALGQPWDDPVTGLAIPAFICQVGYEVTRDVVHRLADGVDPRSYLTAPEGDALSRQVADAIADQLPQAGSLTWATRAAP
jgi:hypothetical protein